MDETRSVVGNRIGLGMAALGRPGYVNLGHADDLQRRYAVADMQAHAFQVLDSAYAGGVRYYDTARSYGRGEAFLSHWLRERGRSPDEVTVGSKWGYTYTADWQVEAVVHEVKEHTLPVLRRQWDESRVLLAPWLRIYQIHSATLESGVLENREVLHELSRLRGQAAIGLSLSGPAQAETLRRAMDVALDGERLFDCVQATWNLLEPSAGAALADAQAAGMFVVVKEAVANGRLTSRNPDAATLQLLQTQASRLQTTVDALALAAVLAQPWVDVVLSGAATVSHLQSNLQALRVSWDEEATTALAPLVESPREYWEARRALAWT